VSTRPARSGSSPACCSGWLASRALAKAPEVRAHSAATAARAAVLCEALDVDPHTAETVKAAAWLHNIGRAPRLRDIGFPPLDGARYLNRHRWSYEVCCLVAHHAGARFEAAERGLADRMWPFVFPDGPALDLLNYADLTSQGTASGTRCVGGPSPARGAAHGARAADLEMVIARVEADLARRAHAEHAEHADVNALRASSHGFGQRVLGQRPLDVS